MNVRAIAALVLVAGLVAAACGGSWKSMPTATPVPSQTSTPVLSATGEPATEVFVPFTPVEEVLTPPPDIDTSGWLTYRDDANGFELKYPTDATVKRNFRRTGPGAAGTGSEIDLVVAQGTRLYDKYLFIMAMDSVSPTDCQPPELSSVKPGGAFGPKRLLGRDAVFWRSEKPGGMMMHFIHDWVYMTLVRNTCLTITGGLYGISPGVLEPDLLPVDYKTESQMFTAIIATFRWLNQP